MEYKQKDTCVINGITVRSRVCILNEEEEKDMYTKMKQILINNSCKDKTA